MLKIFENTIWQSTIVEASMSIWNLNSYPIMWGDNVSSIPLSLGTITEEGVDPEKSRESGCL